MTPKLLGRMSLRELFISKAEVPHLEGPRHSKVASFRNAGYIILGILLYLKGVFFIYGIVGFGEKVHLCSTGEGSE